MRWQPTDVSPAPGLRRVRSSRRLVLLGLLVLCFASSRAAASDEPPVSRFQPVDLDSLRHEVDVARAHPEVYLAHLEAWIPRIEGTILSRPTGRPLRLKEGRVAVEEAIAFLRQQVPVGPLRPSTGMARAANDLAVDQARTGGFGHVASDSSRVAQRLRRYGAWRVRAAELIQYGGRDAREIVALLIVDDGVICRGHRKALYDPSYRFLGVAGAPHPRLRSTWVLTLAAEYEESPVFASAP